MRLSGLLLLALPLALQAQPLTPTVLTPLAPVLAETSDLLLINGALWTLLDSGNPNALYCIDPANGSVLRTVTISNASNVDWEAFTTDANWLYIGDVGNNSGARTDLRVYRIPLAQLQDPDVTTVQADTIRFTYALQSDFTPANNNNDWDGEAMLAMDDSLFLFSKNWVSGTCYLYAMPATPGDHLAVRQDTLNTQGLITGAAYDPANGQIALVGYTSSFFMPFIWQLSDFTDHAFFQGTAVRHDLSIGITQMEGIAWNGATSLHVTNEQNILNTAQLWELDVEGPSDITSPPQQITPAPVPLRICPNPTIDRISVDGLSGVGRWRVLDPQGRLLLEGTTNTAAQVIDLSALAPGSYVLMVDDAMGLRAAHVMKE